MSASAALTGGPAERVSGRVMASVTPATKTPTNIQNSIVARSSARCAGNRIGVRPRQAARHGLAQVSRTWLNRANSRKRARCTASADVLPRSVRITTRRSAHLLWPPIDVDRVRVIATIGDTAFIGPARNDFTVVAIVRIAPVPRNAGLSTLQSVVFGFLCQLAIAFVKAGADLASDDAADNRAADGGQHIATTLADLISDNAARDTAEHETGVGVIDPSLAVATRGQKGAHNQRNRKARNAHGEPRCRLASPAPHSPIRREPETPG